MTLLQSAIFDTGEMATAIAAWKEKRDAEFEPLRRGQGLAVANDRNSKAPCAQSLGTGASVLVEAGDQKSSSTLTPHSGMPACLRASA